VAVAKLILDASGGKELLSERLEPEDRHEDAWSGCVEDGVDTAVDHGALLHQSVGERFVIVCAKSDTLVVGGPEVVVEDVESYCLSFILRQIWCADVDPGEEISLEASREEGFLLLVGQSFEVEVVISIAKYLVSGKEHFLVRSSKAKDSIDVIEIAISILNVGEVKIDTVTKFDAELVSRLKSLKLGLPIRYSLEVCFVDLGTATVDRALDVIGLRSASNTVCAANSN